MNVNFKKNIKRVLKSILLFLLVINIIFNYIEYYTAIESKNFSKNLLDKRFYDKIYGNNQEFILSVIYSKQYTCNVFKIDLLIAVSLLLLMLIWIYAFKD